MPNPTPSDHLVAAGASLLDRYGPFLWRTKVDRETLAIPSNYDCVLGQLDGRFGDAVSEIERLSGVDANRWIYRTGFMPSAEVTAAQLRFAWIRLLPPPALQRLGRAA